MEKKYFTTREIQLAELNILEQFAKFCKENSLNYSVYGGTLLGTIRHKGFIPWDDDIDVIMPRPDYEQFIKLLQNGAIIGKNLYAASPELQKSPDFLFMKIYDKTTKILSDDEVYCNHIWIDVFPIDGLKTPPEKDLRKKVKLQKLFVQKRTQEKKKYRKGISKTRKTLGIIKRLPLKMITYPKLINYIINNCKKTDFDSAEYVSYPVWAKHPGNILKRDWLNETVILPFENIEVCVFGGYKQYLSNRYGKNYMKLPPKEQQITHGIKAYKIEK